MDESPNNPPRTDSAGPKPSWPSGNPSDTVSGERVSVHSIEQEVRSRSKSRQYTNSRSRRNRRKEEEGNGKYLWLSVLAVAMVYLGLLAYSVVQQRRAIQKTPPAKLPAATQAVDRVVKEPEVVPVVVEELPESVASQPAGFAPPSIADLIVHSKRARQLADEGRRLVRDRKYAMAEDKFSEAALLVPYHTGILLDWGRVLVEQKKWSAARDVLLRLVSIEPDSSPGKLMLARTYHHLRQSENALAMARWVLESEPYSEDAHQIAADVYTLNEQHDRAIEHWQRLVALNSNNHVAENNLGVAQMKVGQINQAIRTFENVIRDEPGNSQAHYYLAISFIQKNEPEIAADMLLRASDRFGLQFVYSWTLSPEFAPVRSSGLFQRHFAELMAAPQTLEAATTP